jgi:hypothetical protein
MMTDGFCPLVARTLLLLSTLSTQTRESTLTYHEELGHLEETTIVIDGIAGELYTVVQFLRECYG